MAALASHTRPARVLIVDRLPLSRGALRMALRTQDDLALAGEASSLVEALWAIDDGLEVDVVALDARAARPDMARAIAALPAPVVLLRVEDGPGFVEQALAAGAAAQARKDDVASILDALSAAVAE
jgi:DNA-binding NarL/FixJ family response regulator